jgi:peptide alpha-N-acetyltransferase
LYSSTSYELAVQVLDSYEGTIEGEIPYSERYEHSEMLLYRTTILEESGKVDEALASLDKAKEQVVDTLSFLAQRARLLIKKGDAKGAEATYRELIEVYRHPDPQTPRLPDSTPRPRLPTQTSRHLDTDPHPLQMISCA